MHEQFITSIDYKKLIEMQSKEGNYSINKSNNPSSKSKPKASKNKVKTLGSRKRG